MSWDLYDRRLLATGETTRERQLNQSREDFEREALKNPAYHVAKRNGVDQEFLITRSEVPEKYKIVAFPDEDIEVGDYIEVWGECFLIYQVRVQDTLQKNGMMWLCNHEFVWQNFTSDIIKRQGILDSGVFSSTLMGEVTARSKKRQFKVYLPFDEDTKKIFIDKRIAIDEMYDKFGHKILNVYQVTGYDSESESFGTNGHLLVLILQSDEYNQETDNEELLICDYITPDSSTTTTTLLDCEISGSSYIRLGTSRKYTAVFKDASGNTVTSVTPSWSTGTLPTGVTYTTNGNQITIKVADETELLGQNITLSLTDSGDAYETETLTINLIGL